MKRKIITALKPLTKNINRISITAFSLILFLMILIGTSSIIGMERLNKVNVLLEDSYKVLMQIQNIKESMVRAEDAIREHFYGNGWKSYTDGGMGASASFDMDNQKLNVDILNVGDEYSWAIQILQGSFTLDQNKKYKLSFDAMSTTDRSIKLLFQNSVDYQQHYNKYIDLTNKMNTHTVDFHMKNAKDVLTQIVFALGNIPGKPVHGRHVLTIDNVSLIEVDTGKQLLNNGEFISKDVQSTLLQSKMEVMEAMDSYQAYMSERPMQEGLFNELNVLIEKWLQEKRHMIQDLNLKLDVSGNLSADSELQSYQSVNETQTRISQIIHQIKEMEENRMDENRREATTVKRLVFVTLGLIVFFSIILCVTIYSYLNRAITKPIKEMSKLLKSAESDVSMGKREVIKYDSDHLAISEIYQLHDHIIHYYNLMSEQIQIDGLTGLTNRTTFDHIIGKSIDNQDPFYLILVDIDNFKEVNDTYGHLVGDEIIKLCGKHLRTIADERDVCFRYGGEEFGILIRGREVDDDKVLAIAEDLRIAIAETPNPTGDLITVSIGVSKSQQGDSSPIPVIQRADAALYHSKLEGKNRTNIFN
ncbi:hypothetical protein GCM10011351_12540 [Paraliobacillus quinghaiensis]|uniref:GGDEF domain-containing protein n=1 Tax=Paraliobacillus quinghaiensis TaxID=470815 RepID=A0A917TMA5_9BACI|nr:diguanylate cyclase [Paraliobacillus quinghaiensis]GGM28139.1 hypothetical protein GCM10011351_12540 [Paraliobacillus quinghaiensis]